MYQAQVYKLRVHDDADLSSIEFDDRIEFKLVNNITGKTSKRNYYKLTEGITINEAVKIDTIIYYMHNEIGLNIWSK